jgi:hypothetical protein
MSTIVTFHNHKGGVGSTTLAAHFLHLARELGFSVAGASVDANRELPMWLEPLGIPVVDLASDNGDPKVDLIVIDVQQTRDLPLWPDVTVIPISDTSANHNAGDLADQLRGGIIFLPNKGFKAITPPVHLRDEIEIAKGIPYSRALGYAGDSKKIIWTVPELATTSGAHDLRTALEHLLERVAVLCDVQLPALATPGDPEPA